MHSARRLPIQHQRVLAPERSPMSVRCGKAFMVQQFCSASESTPVEKKLSKAFGRPCCPQALCILGSRCLGLGSGPAVQGILPHAILIPRLWAPVFMLLPASSWGSFLPVQEVLSSRVFLLCWEAIPSYSDPFSSPP